MRKGRGVWGDVPITDPGRNFTAPHNSYRRPHRLPLLIPESEPMTRKPRIDSASEMTRVMSQANRTIEPPSNVPLDDRDLPFFASVIAEFPRSEWTAHQLELAAMLARTMSDLEEKQRLMREEGSVAHSERGTPVVNPRKT